jgi:hypothetical protein
MLSEPLHYVGWSTEEDPCRIPITLAKTKQKKYTLIINLSFSLSVSLSLSLQSLSSLNLSRHVLHRTADFARLPWLGSESHIG